MNFDAFPFGFRVLGDFHGPRRLVNAGAAWAGHCGAVPQAEPHRECYLSAFRFGPDFAEYLKAHGTPKGYAGATCADYLPFDIDRDDLDSAAADAAKLGAFLDDRYPEVEPLAFFSGSKGFHLLLPLAHRPAGGVTFHLTCRRLAEMLARLRGVKIDTAIYDRQRCFRAPNSRHPKTGLHKVRVDLESLVMRDAGAFRETAREAVPFDPPAIPCGCPQLAADWAEAERAVAEAVRAKPVILAGGDGRLQRDTIDLIRNGCAMGERHIRLFRSAANMAEAGGTAPLIHAILDEIGTDLGLMPVDVRRQVDCGIAHATRQAAPALDGEAGGGNP